MHQKCGLPAVACMFWGSAFAQGFDGRSSFRSALSFEAKAGAGEGNRTLVSSLEGYGFTIKLHPRAG